MKQTKILLNNLRDKANRAQNYELSLEIGDIISILIDEDYEDKKAIYEKHFNEKIALIDRLTKIN